MKNVLLFSLIVLMTNIFLSDGQSSTKMENSEVQKATFAGGCFWCMEKPFEELSGVSAVVSGYTGGTTENPNYKNYMQGGHIEVVEIDFDPQKKPMRNCLRFIGGR